MSMQEKFDSRRVLYIERRYFEDPEGNQQFVLAFDELWEAHRALQHLLRDDELLWESDCWLRSSSGLVVRVRLCNPRISCQDTLQAMVEYEPTLREEGKELQDHQMRALRVAREGRAPTTLAEPRVQRERRSSGPRTPAPSGSVHVSVLALQMGIDPSVARGALRKIMSKPAHGWHFSPAELEDVKAKIAEKLK